MPTRTAVGMAPTVVVGDAELVGEGARLTEPWHTAAGVGEVAVGVAVKTELHVVELLHGRAPPPLVKAELGDRLETDPTVSRRPPPSS